jgi:toluene monooxygenase system protein A
MGDDPDYAWAAEYRDRVTTTPLQVTGGAQA